MKLQKPSFSILALIIANLAPLLGVLFLDWDTAAIVLLYWLENLIIGFYNILKMILVRVGSCLEEFLKLFLIPFFCMHFGVFCAFHGLFLAIFFNIGGQSDLVTSEDPLSDPLIFGQLLIAAFGLLVSHTISFFRNYITGKEYLSLGLGELMMRPYKRIVLLHVAIVAGSVLIMKLGSPVPMLCILVILKIIMDIRLHKKSHRAER